MPSVIGATLNLPHHDFMLLTFSQVKVRRNAPSNNPSTIMYLYNKIIRRIKYPLIIFTAYSLRAIHDDLQ